MKKRVISLMMAAVMFMLLMPGLAQQVYAGEYTVTYDPNGGTPGQQWVESEIVTYEEAAAAKPWFTPNYSEEVCAPPEGMEFNGFDINGQRVWEVTAIQPNTLITQDTTIKYLWTNLCTITYDANGGTKGPDWVDSIQVKNDRSDWVDYLPSQQDNVVKAPDGKEFDCYEVNGQKVAAVTSTKILPKGDLTIKYIWRNKTNELYIYEGDFDQIYKKKSKNGPRFKFTREVFDELTFDSFKLLKFDGAVLDARKYVATRGSLDIELDPEFLDTLSDGDHTLQPVFNDGDGPVVTFSINKKSGSGSGSGISYQHEHDYVWRVEKEATPDIDGEMIYVCSKCGSVSQRVAITGYVAFNKDIADRIRAAQPGAAIKVETVKWLSLYSIALDELAKRPDVQLVIDFRHEGKTYEVTIPAGTDAASLKDVNGYAGFLFLGSKFGLTELAR